ncbi:MAG: protein translocase subunit SecF [Theionarchaea archaeon]|nr:protein translocase subunit SecF [Theionarchaea archaeon]MBU7001713.1 protein translocase subunit SecF [Theionarchaea archaeon]MBU7021175.1 protein translocase subunit SecF [Theionarchaea archaeon]MBU7034554.1 protein translocase subunit SecF [Theionarchaea archaeon]MBU7040160.1 protein translocase subunit SecF [Theionarchaea archaeon]
MLKEWLDQFDPTKNPLKGMIGIPLIVLIVFLLILGLPLIVSDYSGPFELRMGMDLQGGTLAMVTGVDPDPSLKEVLSDHFDVYDIDVRSAGGGIAVEAPADVDVVELENVLRQTYPDAEISTSYVGPTMGEDLQLQARNALIIAFVGMTIVVFIAFRSIVPSIAVILSAFSDMAIAAGFMAITGVTLELGTIAALLMVIGYSVDSDILLTTKLLKRRGNLREKVRGAMSTGITMTLTTIAAMVSLYVVSTHPTLDSIAIVLLFALVTDLMNTWMLNTGILMWYLKRRGRT